MSEAQDLTSLAYPCDGCGAEAGQPCPDTCRYKESEYVQEMDEQWAIAISNALPPYDPPPLEESEAKLMAAVHRLPFGGNVGIRGTGAPDRQDYPREEWMARLADWMTEYAEVSAQMIGNLEVDARKSIGLQIELDVLARALARGMQCEST